MVRKKVLNKYVAKRFNNMKLNLDSFYKTSEQEELHLLRVEIKKIRTVARLIDFSTETKQTVFNLKFIDKLFKNAGAIRALHIEINMLKQYCNSTNEFVAQKENELNIKSNQFAKKYNRYKRKISEAEKAFQKCLTDIDSKTVKRFIKNEISKCSKIFKSSAGEKLFHKARIHLKIIQYASSLFNKKLNLEMRIDLKYILQLEETLGSWHDIIVTINKLRINSFNDKTVLEMLETKKMMLQTDLQPFINDFKNNIQLR